MKRKIADPFGPVEEDIIVIAQKRAQISELEDEVKERQRRVNAVFDDLGVKSHKVTTDDGIYQATYVSSSTISIDDEKLKKKIGTAMWNKISTRKLDRAKLEAFIKSNEISSTVVASCSDEVPRTPYTKISYKKA